MLAQVAANFAATEVQADTVLRFCWPPKRRDRYVVVGSAAPARSFQMLLAVNPPSIDENSLSFSSENGAQLFAIHGPARQRAASTGAGYRAFVQSESQAADESKFAGNAS